MSEGGTILVLNAGSSSIKAALFGPDLRRLFRAELEGIGREATLTAKAEGGTEATVADWGDTSQGPPPVARLIDWLAAHAPGGPLAAIGHRVAVGGQDHDGPALVTPALLDSLRALVPLAPLHLPRNLAPIEALAASHPEVPQVVCYDTAFHRTMPPEARAYALPRALTEAGARRYGFHGLSYQYIAGCLPRIDARAAEGRTIVCHLGSGASLCALRGGVSIATTMGFTPLSGLMMATRPGEVDAGLMLWLLRTQGLSVDALERMLYHDSGLKGVSGISADMRDLLASDDPRAAEAIDLFTYTAATEIGRLTAALGGLDALVFTAGIGERSAPIRARIAARCGWLGLALDASANAAHAPRINTPESTVTALVIPTDEEQVIAGQTARLAKGPQSGAVS
ncbi:acetate/propionate family kinase [Thetidibacter halocola]|uniref:Acetate kinase n=1 Tax=Thetidibacter halocola TaxID=2827239 RepID=A0A8J8B8Z6_9RHOB|nr:acetate/propionate family kinase [Thetidibacter halocola]MBS0126017.1 acetate/propionate family kinase [Thetidibacter halocola]